MKFEQLSAELAESLMSQTLSERRSDVTMKLTPLPAILVEWPQLAKENVVGNKRS
jgi:hypothetical protein